MYQSKGTVGMFRIKNIDSLIPSKNPYDKILFLLLRQKVETETHLTTHMHNYLSCYVTIYYKYNFQFETETIFSDVFNFACPGFMFVQNMTGVPYFIY